MDNQSDLLVIVMAGLNARGCDVYSVETQGGLIVAKCADGYGVSLNVENGLTEQQLDHAANTLLFAGIG